MQGTAKGSASLVFNSKRVGFPMFPNEIIQLVLFCVWLLLLKCMSVRVILIVICVSSRFFFYCCTLLQFENVL